MTQPIVGTELHDAMTVLEQRGGEEMTTLLKGFLQDLSISHSKSGASAWTTGPQDEGVYRTLEGVVVSSKELVMRVFLDPEQNYSVEGYAGRTSQSIGPIYLNLDWGPEYESQSSKANAAIRSIGRKEAFDAALQATRGALAPLPDPGAFDIQSVSDAVLAELCTLWFDVPDGVHVQAGGWRLADLLPPARCPGDFSAPSGYIFRPDPGLLLSLVGQRLGRMLRQSVAEFVASRRSPDNPPRGVLSRAFFAALPRTPEDDDLLGRTIIGAMMGMLPTVDGNLTTTVKAWRNGSTFADLGAKLNESSQTDAFARASEVLEKPLIQAMQFAPTPDSVWRTAVKEHTLGTVHPVRVYPGDKIYVSIVKAMQQDLHSGVVDVCPVFGGDRSANPHPVHACPGFEIAMGVLLGVIYGVMEPRAGARDHAGA